MLYASDIYEREQAQIKKLRAASKNIKRFLDTETERKGVNGSGHQVVVHDEAF